MRHNDDFPIKNVLYVCTNERKDGRKSCGHEGQGGDIKNALKKEAQLRGLNKKGLLRVMESSCMALCGQGPNVLCQPSGQWFSQVEKEDVENILDQLELRKNSET